MMIHYCNRLVRWQLHNIQPLRTFFQSGNVKNALRLYITCIETQGENSNCAVPLYFTRNPCAPHRPVTADDRLCLLGIQKHFFQQAAPRPVRRLPSAASHHPAALCRNFAAYYFRSLHLCYLVE